MTAPVPPLLSFDLSFHRQAALKANSNADRSRPLPPACREMAFSPPDVDTTIVNAIGPAPTSKSPSAFFSFGDIHYRLTLATQRRLTHLRADGDDRALNELRLDRAAWA